VNLRHAAALASIGWYLIATPVRWGTLANQSEGFKLDSSVPLPEWNHLASFDSAQQCKAYLSSLQDQARTKLGSGVKRDEMLTLGLFADLTAECIATDDPRLRGD
jgi:hypothetical protein